MINKSNKKQNLNELKASKFRIHTKCMILYQKKKKTPNPLIRQISNIIFTAKRAIA